MLRKAGCYTDVEAEDVGVWGLESSILATADSNHHLEAIELLTQDARMAWQSHARPKRRSKLSLQPMHLQPLGPQPQNPKP